MSVNGQQSQVVRGLGHGSALYDGERQGAAARHHRSNMLPVDPSADDASSLLTLVERSAARLLTALAGLDARELDAASLLAGWSRRTIAAHLAFVATAYQRMTLDALAGRPTTTYPGGRAERERSLRSLDGLPPADVCDRVRATAAGLLTRWRGLDREEWVRRLHGEPVGPMALSRLLTLRATELEAHHVDLGTGHTTRSWPAGFVAACLPLRVAWLGPHHRSRRDADLGIDGRWLLRATDLGHAWVVEASGRTVRCDAAAADDRGDAVLAGPAADLLAFLVGREPAQPLELTEDQALAAAFKRAFPGP